MKENLQYLIKEFNSIKVIELNGNLTSGTVSIFQNLVEKFTENENLIINLENVNSVTSAGINGLVSVSFYAKDYNSRVVLLWANNDILKLAEILDVYNYLIFSESYEEAETKINYFT